MSQETELPDASSQPAEPVESAESAEQSKKGPEPSLADFKWPGDGSREVRLAYVFGTLGLIICPAAMVATALASMALQKGHPKAGHAMIYSVLMLFLAIAAATYMTITKPFG